MIGSVREAYDVGPMGEVIVCGSQGCLIVGQAVRKFDKIVLAFTALVSLKEVCVSMSVFVCIQR